MSRLRLAQRHPACLNPHAADAHEDSQALLEQLVRLLQKLEDSPGNSQAKQGLDDCITQQRQCLLRLTEAGDAVPLLHVMEHIRMRQLQWSSHEVTHRHATALVSHPAHACNTTIHLAELRS